MRSMTTRSPSNRLRVTSCMADNAEATCRAITGWLGAQLGITTEFIDCIPWQERERRLDAGDIQLCWICGLPYARKADAGATIEACVAPVMAAARYAGAPVYYSDIMVRHDSPHRSFADLRGAAWAYNEPDSHSGYNVVRHHLAQLGETRGYFGSAVESGAHQTSLRLIAEGRIDASAIDSTVLEAELRREPALRNTLRSIGTLGPSPMPPWVMHRSLAPQLRASIRSAMLTMHDHAEGRHILAQWGISHFVTVSDADYDSIRRMAVAAGTIPLAA